MDKASQKAERRGQNKRDPEAILKKRAKKRAKYIAKLIEEGGSDTHVACRRLYISCFSNCDVIDVCAIFTQVCNSTTSRMNRERGISMVCTLRKKKRKEVRFPLRFRLIQFRLSDLEVGLIA